VVVDQDLPVAGLAAGIDLSPEFPGPGYRLIEVAQDEADVQVSAATGDGETSWDAPARRAAPERACFHGPAGTQAIRLTTTDPVKSSSAHLRIRVFHVASDAVFPSVAVEAECLESRGGVDHARWDEATAIAQSNSYEKAAQLWESMGERGRAGAAYLQSAWMLTRRTSENSKAFILGERARAAFHLARAPLGEAQASLQVAVTRWALVDAGLAGANGNQDDSERLLALTESELRAAVATFDSAGDAFFSAEARGYLGSNYFQQARLPEAAAEYALAAIQYRAAGELEGANRALINRAIILNRSGSYRETAAAFDRLLQDRGNIGSDEVLADILNNSASTHSAAGNFSKALPQFVQAMQIHERTGDIGGMARSLNGLASTYMRLGVPSAALVYADQAQAVLARRGKSQGGDLDELHASLLAGNAHRALGNLQAARAAHENALVHAHGGYLRVQALLELLRDELDSGDLAAAEARIRLATPAMTGATRMQSLQWQFELARSELIKEHTLAAIDSMRQLQDEFAAAGAREFELEALQAQAAAELARGQLQAALIHTSRSLRLQNELRMAVGDPDLRARLSSLHRAAHDLRVDILDSMRARALDPARKEKYLLQMFAAGDEARAGLVHESADAGFLASDATGSAELRQVAAEIAFREHTLAAIETGTAPGMTERNLRAELAVLRARYDSLTPPQAPAAAEFVATDYRVAGLREDTGILLFLSAQKVLRRYWLTRRGIQELDPAAPGSDHMLPDAALLRGHPHLIMVADSAVAAMPFAALSAPGDVEPLVARHDVTMALTLRDAIRIAAMSDAQRRPSLAKVALFYDPVFTPFDKRVLRRPPDTAAFPAIARLTATETEANAIAGKLNSSKVWRYGGLAATRNAALNSPASEATVLHFATHAIASDQWPFGSGLLLTAFDDAGEPMNGFLSSLDLLSRRARTDLVVLSACDTASGDRSAAENVAGLARAFLGGGARRVVATRWAVDDTITAKVMGKFYAGLAAGQTPAAALSAAQRAIYSAAPRRDEKTWASFVLYERAPNF
jgi:tetratricopeptide (TPR) repeat protein